MNKNVADPFYTEQYKALHNNSAGYGASSSMLFREVRLLINHLSPESILDFGCGKGVLIDKIARRFPDIKCYKYDPSILGIDTIPVESADFVINTDVLEHVPEYMFDDVLNSISSLSQTVFFNLHHGLAETRLPSGENAHCTVKPPGWYHDKLARYFKTITPLPGRSRVSSVVVTCKLPVDLVERYNSIIVQPSRVRKIFVKLLSSCVPIRSWRRNLRDYWIYG